MAQILFHRRRTRAALVVLVATTAISALLSRFVLAGKVVSRQRVIAPVAARRLVATPIRQIDIITQGRVSVFGVRDARLLPGTVRKHGQPSLLVEILNADAPIDVKRPFAAVVRGPPTRRRPPRRLRPVALMAESLDVLVTSPTGVKTACVGTCRPAIRRRLIARTVDIGTGVALPPIRSCSRPA